MEPSQNFLGVNQDAWRVAGEFVLLALVAAILSRPFMCILFLLVAASICGRDFFSHWGDSSLWNEDENSGGSK